jgi:tetratricopeptide (TPR) repeat protein
MVRALVLIMTGVFNALFCVLRPAFYWDNPRFRALRRWMGDTSVLLLSLAMSVLSIGSGVYLFDRSMDERRLTEIQLSMNGGNADSIAHALEEYVAEFPTNTTAWTLMGTVQQRTHPDRAEAAFRKALDVDPGLVRPYIGLAVIAASGGRLEDAERLLRQALENDTSNAEVYTNLALLDLKRYRDADGLRNAEHAFALDQGSADITANLAVAYHYNGRIQERNLMAHAARTLGFTDEAFLRRVFDGMMTIRDERYAPPDR